jgi:pimeloyl-ACP methyl ester carboxylesterase
MAAGYVDTNGVRLWYEELGRPDGAPVLLVMGGGASVVWWPPELLQGLVGAGYRVVQFDNRDTGLSSYVDWASAPYGIQDMAGDAMGVLDGVGIDAAHLVGVSVGRDGLPGRCLGVSRSRGFLDAHQHHPGA